MKSLTSFLLVAVLLLHASLLFSQDLQIQRGNKTKTFKTGHLVRVDLPVKDSIDCNKCQKHYIIGRLVSYTNQVLMLRMRVESEPIIENKKDIGSKGNVYKDKMEAEWPAIEIPSNSILEITKQGTKKWQPVNAGDLFGGALTAGGLSTLLAANLAENEENSDALIDAGATMTVMGLVMITVFNRKTYYLDNPGNTPTKQTNKLWTIK